MATATVPQSHSTPERNPGIPFDPGTIESALVNKSAIERRAATLPTRRTVKKEWQAAWLLHAIKTIDLTTLSGDDTPGTVRRLCAKARQPVRPELLRDLGVAGLSLQVGAVCVYHTFVEAAVKATGLALRQALTPGGAVFSTKGAIDVAWEDNG